MNWKNWSHTEKVRLITLLAVAVVSISFVFFILRFDQVMKCITFLLNLVQPFIWGFVIAYLLWRPLSFFERVMEKYLYKGRLKEKGKRAISIVVTLLVVLLAISILAWVVIPQLAQSVATLYNNFPSYLGAVEKWINELLQRFGSSSNIAEIINQTWDTISSFATQVLSQALTVILSMSLSISSAVVTLCMAFIISIYMLAGKEKFGAQCKKLLYSLFPPRFNEKVLWLLNIFDEAFGGYLSGQILDSLLVGIVMAVLMTIFGLPYAMLIGMIIFITNILPIIGPWLGAIPSGFILLMAGNPMDVVWFAIMILVVQQIDGNIVAPKIIGGATGIPGFWALFAILVGGGIWGIPGILLSIPTLSVIFTVLKLLLEKRLKKRGYPTRTEEYLGKIITVRPAPEKED